jgi:type IV pilus assembly protein PilA
MTQWYYADRQRQQQGPIDAAALAAAFATGEVNAASLVWREGMSGWVPLAEVAAELGLEMPAAPPRQAAHRAAAPPKAGSAAMWIVVAAVVGIGLIFVLGIILAISIPAYSDYTTRARVSEALADATLLKVDVDEFMHSESRCPANGDAGFGAPEDYANDVVARIDVGELPDGACTIEVVLAGTDAAIAGRRIRFERHPDSDWIISSSVDDRHLPGRYRGQPKL